MAYLLTNGTTVYYTHNEPRNTAKCIRELLEMLEDSGYCIDADKIEYKSSFDFSLIPRILDGEDELDLNLRDRTLIIEINKAVPDPMYTIRVNISEPKYGVLSSSVLWNISYPISLEAVDVSCYALDDPNECSLEDLFNIYNLFKKIFVKLDFDKAFGSSTQHYYSYEDADSYNIFRFDKNGPCRLVLPLEERREYISKDSDVRELSYLNLADAVSKSSVDSIDPLRIEYYLSEDDHNVSNSSRLSEIIRKDKERLAL